MMLRPDFLLIILCGLTAVHGLTTWLSDMKVVDGTIGESISLVWESNSALDHVGLRLFKKTAKDRGVLFSKGKFIQEFTPHGKPYPRYQLHFKETKLTLQIETFNAYDGGIYSAEILPKSNYTKDVTISHIFLTGVIQGPTIDSSSGFLLGICAATLSLACLTFCIVIAILLLQLGRRHFRKQETPTLESKGDCELVDHPNHLSHELNQSTENNACLRKCCEDLRSVIDTLRICQPEDNAPRPITVRGDYNQNCHITKVQNNAVSVTPDCSEALTEPFRCASLRKRALPQQPEAVEETPEPIKSVKCDDPDSEIEQAAEDYLISPQS